MREISFVRNAGKHNLGMQSVWAAVKTIIGGCKTQQEEIMGSIVFSIFALVFALIGLVPLLGIFNWIAIILAFVALISGIVGAAVGNRRGACVVGILISVIVLCVAVIRLVLGGGLL